MGGDFSVVYTLLSHFNISSLCFSRVKAFAVIFYWDLFCSGITHTRCFSPIGAVWGTPVFYGLFPIHLLLLGMWFLMIIVVYGLPKSVSNT